MLLHLTDISSEPLQQQIVRQIRAKILASELPAGTGLPSIRVFSREYHVSVITVKRAYEILERDGLIHSRRGKGFYISEILNERKKEMAKQRLMDTLKSQINNALAEGLSSEDVMKIVRELLKNKKCI